MPGQFPLPARGNMFTNAKNLYTMPARTSERVDVPNMVFPSAFNVANKKGVPMIRFVQNIRSLGTTFQEVNANNTQDPVNVPLTIKAVIDRIAGFLSYRLSGVSRDSTGATLGNCRVMIFRTADNVFIMETTSDANGDWSVSLMAGGPYFQVEYKIGSPDLAGTSVNTLVPV